MPGTGTPLEGEKDTGSPRRYAARDDVKEEGRRDLWGTGWKTCATTFLFSSHLWFLCVLCAFAVKKGLRLFNYPFKSPQPLLYPLP